MGYRLSKIYTRTGDKGTTGLGDGSRISKDDARVMAMGEVDELNACLGKLLTLPCPPEVSAMLTRIQHELFNLGGELCLPGQQFIQTTHVEWLEQQLDGLNAHLTPLAEFILPGGTAAAAECHLARTVCRRAERSVITLGKDAAVNEPLLAYLNRLSDLLFVTARYLNKSAGHADVLWQR
ncbi:MAG: cob(I)yrinic acid a,c-diamide adenosyltransferase [Pseudomonadota bacterium]